MWIVIATMLASVAFALACVAIYQVRAARSEMVLVDGAGRERVRIAATDEGGAIELMDEAGRTRIALRQTAEQLSISMHRREAPADGSPDFAMRYVVEEKSHLNSLEMREPADQTVIRLGGMLDAFLSLQSGAGHAAFLVSNAGADFFFDYLETRVALRLLKHGAYVDHRDVSLKLDDVFLPRK